MYGQPMIAFVFALLLQFYVAAGQTDKETGGVSLTQDQFQAIYNGTAAALATDPVVGGRGFGYRVSSVIYGWTGWDYTYYDCWCQFQRFLQCMRPFFQSFANRFCRPYFGVWCCPNTKFCFVFAVYPQKPCWIWNVPPYQSILPVFEPKEVVQSGKT